MAKELSVSEQAPIKNVLTINAEDWFQSPEVSSVIGREQWERCEHRLEAMTYRLLALLEQAAVRATFFVLGWNAEHYPGLVREICRRGHEVAIHGYQAEPVYRQTATQFAWEINRCQQLMEEIAGEPAVGYRAAGFSVGEGSLWALEVLAEHGIKYDSSCLPARRGRGLPDWCQPYRVARAGKSLLAEFPVSPVWLAGWQAGYAGGGHLRFLPYRVTAGALRRLNRRGLPGVVYLRLWELDTGQPRQRLHPWQYLRRYGNLEEAEPKLERLLLEFAFAPMRQVLREQGERLPVFEIGAGGSWASAKRQEGHPQTT